MNEYQSDSNEYRGILLVIIENARSTNVYAEYRINSSYFFQHSLGHRQKI